MRFVATTLLLGELLGVLFFATYYSVSPSERETVPVAATSNPPARGDGEILTVDTAEFEVFLKDTDEPLVVDFWANWCGSYWIGRSGNPHDHA